jgi:hypothetical protein
MKFFLKYIAPVLAILWLANVHPLGAMVAIGVCVLRCAFKSRVFSHMFAHFVYDVLKVITLGGARLVFKRRRS